MVNEDDRVEVNLSELIRALVSSSKLSHRDFIVYVKRTLSLMHENTEALNISQYDFMEDRLKEYVWKNIISVTDKDRILKYEWNNMIIRKAKEFNDIPIIELFLSTRVYNVLLNYNKLCKSSGSGFPLEKLSDFISVRRSRLMKLPRTGKQTVEDIENTIKEHGILLSD